MRNGEDVIFRARVEKWYSITKRGQLKRGGRDHAGFGTFEGV